MLASPSCWPLSPTQVYKMTWNDQEISNSGPDRSGLWWMMEMSGGEGCVLPRCAPVRDAPHSLVLSCCTPIAPTEILTWVQQTRASSSPEKLGQHDARAGSATWTERSGSTEVSTKTPIRLTGRSRSENSRNYESGLIFGGIAGSAESGLCTLIQWSIRCWSPATRKEPSREVIRARGRTSTFSVQATHRLQ